MARRSSRSSSSSSRSRAAARGAARASALGSRGVSLNSRGRSLLGGSVRAAGTAASVPGGFGEYDPMTTQFSNLSRTEQERVLSEYESAAKDQLDPYYNEMFGLLSEKYAQQRAEGELRTKLAKEGANLSYNQFQTQQTTATGDDLSEAARQRAMNDTLDSGVAFRQADDLIARRATSLLQAQQRRDQTISAAEQNLAVDNQGTGIYERVARGELGREQRTEIGRLSADYFGRDQQLEFLGKQRTAGTYFPGYTPPSDNPNVNAALDRRFQRGLIRSGYGTRAALPSPTPPGYSARRSAVSYTNPYRTRAPSRRSSR